MSQYHNELKKRKKNPDKYPISIDFHGKTISLRPITNSKYNVKVLSKWRKQNWYGFLTKFRVTEQGTKRWINNIIEDPERILFLIILGNKKIGHIGIHKYDKKNKTADIDSVLRAVKGGHHGFMEAVLKAMFEWMFNELKLSKVRLVVFSDNYKAINLYERSGMLTVNSLPLRRIVNSDGWKWEKTKLQKDEFAERYQNIMEITNPKSI